MRKITPTQLVLLCCTACTSSTNYQYYVWQTDNQFMLTQSTPVPSPIVKVSKPPPSPKIETVTMFLCDPVKDERMPPLPQLPGGSNIRQTIEALTDSVTEHRKYIRLLQKSCKEYRVVK